jgi:hypothetical protein
MKPLCTLVVMAAPLVAGSANVYAATSASLISVWSSSNENCRGGPGNAPETMRACDAREVISRELNQRGCKYHNGDRWTCK